MKVRVRRSPRLYSVTTLPSKTHTTANIDATLVVLVVQRFGVGLVIERLLVRFKDGALSAYQVN